MKKTSTFTLVRKPVSRDPDEQPSTAIEGKLSKKVTRRRPRVASKVTLQAYDRFKALSEKAVMEAVGDRRLREAYARQDENFKATLRSVLGSSVKELSGAPSRLVVRKVQRIAEELARSNNVIKVGILDLGAWVSDLAILIERLNDSQDMFTLFEILAPIPAGLVKTPEGFRQWLAQHGGPNLDTSGENASAPHIIFDEFLVAAEDTRVKMGLDLIVGVTPYMVAGEDDGPFWNHFAATAQGSILISVADLREYAEQAARPFEAAVGVLLVSSIFAAVIPDLDFHPINTGCLFDYNQRRPSMIDTVKALRIDQECLAKMDDTQQKTVKSMLSVLRRMKRKGPR